MLPWKWLAPLLNNLFPDCQKCPILAALLAAAVSFGGAGVANATAVERWLRAGDRAPASRDVRWVSVSLKVSR
jgi:hypothetical protein